MISSTNNAQIKNIVQLQKKSKARKESSTFVVEGIKMYEEVPINMRLKTFVSEEFYNNHFQNGNLLVGGNIVQDEFEVVADSVFKEISETMTPQGVIGIVKQPKYDFDKIIKKEKIKLLFLEDIRDPGNLGTMVRTAEGAGMDGIILSKESVDMYNPKVIRSTMGAIYRVPFIYEEHFLEALKTKYSINGINFYAAHLEGAIDYTKVNYSEKCGIIIGNEANGISEEVSNYVNQLIKIPMQGKLESLNAAVSAAIIMYEVFRQQRS